MPVVALIKAIISEARVTYQAIAPLVRDHTERLYIVGTWAYFSPGANIANRVSMFRYKDVEAGHNLTSTGE